MKVRPAPGRDVRDPQSRQLIHADEWTDVADSSYWRRRIASGDVEMYEAATDEPLEHGAPGTPYEGMVRQSGGEWRRLEDQDRVPAPGTPLPAAGDIPAPTVDRMVRTTTKREG